MHFAEIGWRIRQARKARGLTQAALAAQAGISRETLNQLESGMARDLGLAKILRLVRILDLQLLLLETHAKAGTDYVRFAATAGSTGFREALSEAEVARALLSGTPPPRKGPHFRRLLEDSPAGLIHGLVTQVSQWSKPGKVQRNLAALAKKLDVRMRPGWTKSD